MTCIHCKLEVPEGASKCGYCGDLTHKGCLQTFAIFCIAAVLFVLWLISKGVNH